jgi:ElaB/YqjD/DUF883 family membrane-anchored ribosome-binding protein
MSEMTEQRPDELRREIARTRADMDRTLAELEDRVSPSRIRERQTERMRSRWRRTRDAVMGSPDEGPGAISRLSDRASDVSQSMRDAPERVEEVARGNPLAAGMIAFGLGALAGSMFPSSGLERSLASELRDEFEEPVRSELQQAGEQLKADLQEHGQHAIDDTKRAAQEGLQRTTEQARGSADEVREHAQGSAEHLRDRS